MTPKKQPPHLFVQDILDLHWCSYDGRCNDKLPYAVSNQVGELRRVFPIFVSFSKSYSFYGDGLGTVLDRSGAEYVIEELAADERERAMGFPTGTTQLPNHFISKYQRRMLLGQAMDLNCLTLITAIALVEQHCLHTLAPSAPSFSKLSVAMQNLPLSKTDFEVTRGGWQQRKHPLKRWDTKFF